MAHFLLLTVMALRQDSLRKRRFVQMDRGKEVIESGVRAWPFLLYPKTFYLCTCASLNKSVPSSTQSGMVCKLLCSSDPPEGLRKPRLRLTLPGDFVSMIKVESAFGKTPHSSLFTFFKCIFYLPIYLHVHMCVHMCVPQLVWGGQRTTYKRQLVPSIMQILRL